ncbi:MAG: DUF3800 domain-containing protein [Planctomycetes bacterium]|nr:DUF3800 domain-containing protein [Planctomycetota bacterium]
MTCAFRVYIDESGDEGFVFNPDGSGSSEWFVLSAVVTRTANDRELIDLIDQTRAQLGRQPREPLHFRKLKHEQRLPLVDRIAKAKVRLVSVLVHKPSLQEPEKFSERFLLYRYATRYLLERVSWLCRDTAGADGPQAKVIFSNRSAMSYDELRDYLAHLQARTQEFDVRVDWSAIDPSRIEARTHDSLCGLQVADAVASSFFYGVNRTRHGFTEPRYAQLLAPVVYRRKSVALGYGIKLWPREVSATIEQRPGAEWLASYK